MGFWRFLAEPCTGVGHNIGHPPPPLNNVEEQKNRHNICHPRKIRDAEIQLCFGGEGVGVAYIMAYTGTRFSLKIAKTS